MGQTDAFVEPRPKVAGTIRPRSERTRARRALIAMELLTGGSALLSGGLLAIRPDGSWLGLPTQVLVGGPFADWRLPGLLLGALVGVGLLTQDLGAGPVPAKWAGVVPGWRWTHRL